MTSHMPSRLRGSSPVVGSSRNSSRGRPMSALARSSRRCMPPEYVLTTRSAGVHQLELVEELVRPALGLGTTELVQPAEHPQVLAPGEVLVDRGELAGEADHHAQLVRLAHDVEPGHGGPTGVRPKQRREDADRRRLAAPLGPRRPRTVPSQTLRSNPSRARTWFLPRLVDLDKALGQDRGLGHRGDRGVGGGVSQAGAQCRSPCRRPLSRIVPTTVGHADHSVGPDV